MLQRLFFFIIVSNNPVVSQLGCRSGKTVISFAKDTLCSLSMLSLVGHKSGRLCNVLLESLVLLVTSTNSLTHDMTVLRVNLVAFTSPLVAAAVAIRSYSCDNATFFQTSESSKEAFLEEHVCWASFSRSQNKRTDKSPLWLCWVMSRTSIMSTWALKRSISSSANGHSS
jgi:hypothetical protein